MLKPSFESTYVLSLYECVHGSCNLSMEPLTPAVDHIKGTDADILSYVGNIVFARDFTVAMRIYLLLCLLPYIAAGGEMPLDVWEFLFISSAEMNVHMKLFNRILKDESSCFVRQYIQAQGVQQCIDEQERICEESITAKLGRGSKVYDQAKAIRITKSKLLLKLKKDRTAMQLTLQKILCWWHSWRPGGGCMSLGEYLPFDYFNPPEEMPLSLELGQQGQVALVLFYNVEPRVGVEIVATPRAEVNTPSTLDGSCASLAGMVLTHST